MFCSCRTSYRSSEKYLGFRCFPLILVETPLRLYTWRLECERFDASCHRSPRCFTDHFTGILDTQTILHVHAIYVFCYTACVRNVRNQISADTKGLDITGSVTVNGQSMSKSFFLENAAYVPQEDRLWSALTGDGVFCKNSCACSNSPQLCRPCPLWFLD